LSSGFSLKGWVILYIEFFFLSAVSTWRQN